MLRFLGMLPLQLGLLSILDGDEDPDIAYRICIVVSVGL